MFPSLIREGEEVASPTGRKWLVTGWADQRKRVALVASDGSGDEVELDPKLLRHVSGKTAGALLAEISPTQPDLTPNEPDPEAIPSFTATARRILKLPAKLVLRQKDE